MTPLYESYLREKLESLATGMLPVMVQCRQKTSGADGDSWHNNIKLDVMVQRNYWNVVTNSRTLVHTIKWTTIQILPRLLNYGSIS
jgi:hypothetical protein